MNWPFFLYEIPLLVSGNPYCVEVPLGVSLATPPEFIVTFNFFKKISQWTCNFIFKVCALYPAYS